MFQCSTLFFHVHSGASSQTVCCCFALMFFCLLVSSEWRMFASTLVLPNRYRPIKHHRWWRFYSSTQWCYGTTFSVTESSSAAFPKVDKILMWLVAFVDGVTHPSFRTLCTVLIAWKAKYAFFCILLSVSALCLALTPLDQTNHSTLHDASTLSFSFCLIQMQCECSSSTVNVKRHLFCSSGGEGLYISIVPGVIEARYQTSPSGASANVKFVHLKAKERPR